MYSCSAATSSPSSLVPRCWEARAFASRTRWPTPTVRRRRRRTAQLRPRRTPGLLKRDKFGRTGTGACSLRIRSFYAREEYSARCCMGCLAVMVWVRLYLWSLLALPAWPQVLAPRGSAYSSRTPCRTSPRTYTRVRRCAARFALRRRVQARFAGKAVHVDVGLPVSSDQLLHLVGHACIHMIMSGHRNSGAASGRRANLCERSVARVVAARTWLTGACDCRIMCVGDIDA